MLSAGCAHVEPSWAHLGLMLGPSQANVAPSGPSWAYVGPWAHLGLCWAHLVGPCWPMLGLSWPMLSHLGSYVGAMFGPSMLKRS